MKGGKGSYDSRLLVKHHVPTIPSFTGPIKFQYINIFLDATTFLKSALENNGAAVSQGTQPAGPPATENLPVLCYSLVKPFSSQERFN